MLKSSNTLIARREATKKAYEEILDRFLDSDIDRQGREAILLSLITEIAGEELADLSKDDERRIKQAISRAMQNRALAVE